MWDVKNNIEETIGNTPQSNIVLEAIHITKYFHDPIKVQVLNKVDFSLTRGEFVSICLLYTSDAADE